MLGFFSRFKRIYLWMDADQAGKVASENFAKVKKNYLNYKKIL